MYLWSSLRFRRHAKLGGQSHPTLIDDGWPETGLVVHPLRGTWTRASLILIVVALGAETVGKNHDGAGMMNAAKSAAAINRAKEFAEFGMDELALEELDLAARLRDLASLKGHGGGFWHLAGLVLFVIALACFGLSRYLGEWGFSLTFSLLLLVYIIWLMMLV
jgi:hypothetical protein